MKKIRRRQPAIPVLNWVKQQSFPVSIVNYKRLCYLWASYSKLLILKRTIFFDLNTCLLADISALKQKILYLLELGQTLIYKCHAYRKYKPHQKIKKTLAYNIRNKKPESWKKILRQSKEVKQNWTGPRNFEIYCCVILSNYHQNLISEGVTEHQDLSTINCEISLCFLTSWTSTSIIVRQLVSQLVCKVYYTRNQLPFYFRWTKRILKYCILPLYYFYYCSLLQILLLQCGFCYLDGDKTEYTYFDKFFNLFFDLLTNLDTKLSSRNVDDL